MFCTGNTTTAHAPQVWSQVCCHAGHNEVVQYLLEVGAVCNEYTFDGDRCHYAALNLGIRMLLRQFEARPPPLSPLATSLRGLSSLCENPEVKPQSECQSWLPHCVASLALQYIM